MAVKSGRIVAVAAVLTVLGTSQAWAGPPAGKFKDYCTTGAIKACASTEIYYTWDGTNTTFRIRVANLQGWDAFRFANKSAALYKVTLKSSSFDFGEPDRASLTVAAIDGAIVSGTGTPLDDWRVYESSDKLKIRLKEDDVRNTPTGALFGCDLSDAESSYVQTCNGGWLEFTFLAPYEVTANIELALEWKVVIDGVKYKCDTDASPGHKNECSAFTTTTPEPVTIILLGSGLLALGGVGIIRRRRGFSVESE